MPDFRSLAPHRWVILGFVSLFFACAPTAVSPPLPLSRHELVGTWHGKATASVYGDIQHPGRHVESVQLVIFDDSLKGRFVHFFGKGKRKSYPFQGKVEGNELVARWKGGRWLRLRLVRTGGALRLEGPYDFFKVSGEMSLVKE